MNGYRAACETVRGMGEKRFLVLDGMRGVAALAVLVIHMGGEPARFVSGGYLAVDFFFCLSGFVLAHAYGEAGLSLAGFLRMRGIRLYPLYAVGLVLGVVAAVGLGIGPLQIAEGTAFSLFFLPTPLTLAGFPGAPGSIYPLDPPAWSLFFEVLANAAWFPLRRWLTGLSGALVLACCAGGLVASVMVYGISAGAYWTNLVGGFGRVAFGFLAGTLTYQVWRRSTWRPRLPWWLVTGFLLVILCAPVDRHLFDTPAVLLLTPPVVFLGACCDGAGRASEMAQRLLGDSSYAVYTLHYPVIILVDLLVGPLRASALPLVSAHPSAVTTPLTILLVVGAALWLDRIYDRPVRRWLTRRLSSVRMSDAAVSAGPQIRSGLSRPHGTGAE